MQRHEDPSTSMPSSSVSSATEAQLRDLIRATLLGKPLFEELQPIAPLPDDYARRLQADDGTPWWQKLIEQTTE